MANPLSAAAFMKAFVDEGLEVVEHGNWETHNRTSATGKKFGPVHGVLNHHTVTSGHDKTIDILRKGYSGLPGPLCNFAICKKGHAHMIGYGRANHAGLGDDDVLRAMINGNSIPTDNEANTDGNSRFYGGEYENLGNGKDPWPDAQLDAIIKANTAILRAHRKKGDDWNADDSVLGHLEWQPGKIDPRGFSMHWLRDQVHARLKTTPGTAKKYHTVEKGDTMWAIARKYGTTVTKLRPLNPHVIDFDEIYPGMKIRVK